MAKHQIILIHGMGNFEAGWSGDAQKILVDKMNSYDNVKQGNFAAGFEFKEVTYSDVFEAWRQQWKTDAQAAAKSLTDLKLDSGAAEKLVGLAALPTGDDFWRTHVLDVVMYRYLMPLTEAVRRSVQTQIVGHIDSFPVNDRPRYSVVAHSLGTAVMYETYHAMLTDPGGLPGAYRPENFFAVSNVIKPLWNRGGTCYPLSLGPNLSDADGLCYRWGNFGHALDPFCNFDRFDPPDSSWFASSGPADAVYKNIVLPAEAIQNWNIHALEHYLGHPSVHVPLIRMLTAFDDIISDAELNDAATAWQNAALSEIERQATQAFLDKLNAPGSAGFVNEIDSILAFRDRVVKSGPTDGES